MHTKFLLIALFTNKATTLLSTPPDKAQITLSFLTFFLISFTNLFFSEGMRQVLLILQIKIKNF